MNDMNDCKTIITTTMMGPDFIEINYNISRYIKNRNIEQIDDFKKRSGIILEQVYKYLDKEDVKMKDACISLLVNCLYLEIDIDINVIPKLIELYKFHTYQSQIEKVFENLLVGPVYTNILLENDEFLNTSLPIYLYRGLTRLLANIQHSKYILDDDIIYLLEFTYIYTSRHVYSSVTKQTFEDCLYILVNCAYLNFIQPEFVPMVRELFIHSESCKMRYLCLTYLYNVHHDKLYTKHIGLFFVEFARQFIEKDYEMYPVFCALLQDELQGHELRGIAERDKSLKNEP